MSFLVASLNSPVYVSVPVQDAKVVDKFLDQLDAGLARLARQRERGGFFPLDHDFYKVPLAGSDARIRCYGISLGPVKWRLFYARLGNVLYIASKQCILEDLVTPSPPPRVEGQAALTPLSRHHVPRAGEGSGPTAHAMIRVRPEHWKAVLPEYRLGLGRRQPAGMPGESRPVVERGPGDGRDRGTVRAGRATCSGRPTASSASTSIAPTAASTSFPPMASG